MAKAQRPLRRDWVEMEGPLMWWIEPDRAGNPEPPLPDWVEFLLTGKIEPRIFSAFGFPPLRGVEILAKETNANRNATKIWIYLTYGSWN